MLTLQAPAKLNLVLEVLGRRDDGYHEIISLIQTVSLFDVLTFKPDDELKLTCTARELNRMDNLVLKAAAALKRASGCAGGARIRLKKNIPWGAGLGGGSSDAAAALTGLNQLWSLNLPSEKLADIGAGVGSDVPFFIYGGTCLVEGRGEKVTLLPDVEPAWFVLLTPEVQVEQGKTARLYRRLGTEDYWDGRYVAQARADLARSNRIVPGLLFNIFDSVAVKAFPGLDACWSALQQAGTAEVHLAGSGPTLFTAVRSENEAEAIRRKLAINGMESIVVTTVRRAIEQR